MRRIRCVFRTETSCYCCYFANTMVTVIRNKYTMVKRCTKSQEMMALIGRILVVRYSHACYYSFILSRMSANLRLHSLLV